MKQLLFALILIFTITTGSAQNAKQDKSGNYTAISKTTANAPAKNSGKTFTDAKGKTYPVMVSAKGKLYIDKISKTGKSYKMYLKL